MINKKPYLIFAVLIMLTFAISGCSMRKSTHLIEGGTYAATPMGGNTVFLRLENGEFTFFDPTSSQLTSYENSCHGVYDISGDKLELQCADSEDKFIFTVSDNKLYLDRDNSSSLNIMIPRYNLELQFTGEEVCFSLLSEAS